MKATEVAQAPSSAKPGPDTPNQKALEAITNPVGAFGGGDLVDGLGDDLMQGDENIFPSPQADDAFEIMPADGDFDAGPIGMDDGNFLGGEFDPIMDGLVDPMPE